MSMKKTRCDSTYRLIAAMAFSLALPVSITAQDLVVWFAKPYNTAVYGSIAAQVEPLGASIKAASLSDSLLAKRLEEASKKHIPPCLSAQDQGRRVLRELGEWS